MARSIGSLFVNIVAKTKDFDRKMKKTETGLKRFETRVVGMGKQLVSMSSIGLAGAAMGFAAFARQQMVALDVLGKTAAKLGETTENMSKLHYAASKTGVSVQTFNMALQRFVRRVAEASVGTGEARDAIKELGLDAGVLKGLGPSGAFYRVAEAIQQVSSQADRVRIAMKLFDSEGVALVNTLNLGAKGLNQFAREAEATGAVVSGKTVKAMERLNDELTRFKANMAGAGRTALAPILYVFDGLVIAVNRLIEGLRTVIEIGPKAFRAIGGGLGGIGRRGGMGATGASQTAWPGGPSSAAWGDQRVGDPVSYIGHRGAAPRASTIGADSGGWAAKREAARGMGASVAPALGSALMHIGSFTRALTNAAALDKRERGSQSYAGLYEKGTASAYSRQLGKKDPQKELSETAKKQHKELQLHTSMFKDWGRQWGELIGQAVSIPSG